MSSRQDTSVKFIKSPLNYIGGKYKILGQMYPLFPRKIETFVDLFAGGFNVGINIEAEKIICNDHINYIIDLFCEFRERELEDVLNHIHCRIDEFKLSKQNEEGFKSFRQYYNENKITLDLYVLVCFSFNYQIRFNNKHEYNTPFGRERSSYNKNTEENLISFIKEFKSKNIEFLNRDFLDIDLSYLDSHDFVYCDPPYLITTGSYNDGKRGFKDWGEREERQLLELLDRLNRQGVRFALSNVLEHKGQVNGILLEWSRDYIVNYLSRDYKNCNYQFKNKDNRTSEVLITNYSL